jgi:hypothetical protein
VRLSEKGKAKAEDIKYPEAYSLQYVEEYVTARTLALSFIADRKRK